MLGQDVNKYLSEYEKQNKKPFFSFFALSLLHDKPLASFCVFIRVFLSDSLSTLQPCPNYELNHESQRKILL